MANVFPDLPASFVKGSVYRWALDPWSRGAFAVFRPGQMSSPMPDIPRPEGRLHFAGEHTSSWMGWMEGALESGGRAAGEVLGKPAASAGADHDSGTADPAWADGRGADRGDHAPGVLRAAPGRLPVRVSFVARFRGVNSPTFTNAVVLMFVATFVLGGLLYPRYRIDVRPMLEDLQLRAANGIFETKEHLRPSDSDSFPSTGCTGAHRSRPNMRPPGST